MIRLIQHKLIIPRGDTGSFTIPVLHQGDVAVFSIFNELTHTTIFQKSIIIDGDVLNVEFTHEDTVDLPLGKYVWDIKIYSNPEYNGERLINGEEVNSYYAGFKLPECEIKETPKHAIENSNRKLF